MKILTWNINGIRAGSGKPNPVAAVSGVHAAGTAIKGTLDNLHADIVCLQETKVTRDQLEESIALVKGYESFFAFCRVKAGYSGVATYCREHCSPVFAEEGLTPAHQPPGHDGIGCYGELEHWSESDRLLVDCEGRAVLTEHRLDHVSSAESNGGLPTSLVLINVYCPMALMEDVQRYEYKMMFYRALELRSRALRAAGKHVIVLGDVNCSHRAIDVCGAEDCKADEFNNRPSRLWLDNLIIDTHARLRNATPTSTASSPHAPNSSDGTCRGEGCPGDHGCYPGSDGVGDGLCDDEDVSSDNWKNGQSCSPLSAAAASAGGGLLVDSFRHFHPTRPHAYTCWSTMTGARQTNYGTRIDYVLADEQFVDEFAVSADVLPEVEGSDHCPVYLDTKCRVLPPASLPSLCASKMPEFSGKQQSMMSFVRRSAGNSCMSSSPDPSAPSVASTSVAIYGHAVQSSSDVTATGAHATQDSTVASCSSRLPVALLKRSSSSSAQSERKRACVGRQQASIAGFFQRKTATSTTTQRSVSVTDGGDSDLGSSVESANSLSGSHSISKVSDPLVKPCSASVDAGAKWKNLFSSSAPKPVLCKGHKEPCVLRTVNKSGANQFRKFYVCARPAGAKDNPLARCEHFEWIDKPKFKQKLAQTSSKS